MIIRDRSGLFFPEGEFHLDPLRKAARAVISHAHADHAIPSNSEVWCTPETMAIMKARYGDKLKSRFHVVAYHQEFSLGKARLKLVPAGHMLGSAQVVIDLEGKRHCYTGDFKIRQDDSCAHFEPVPCDVLITESTFADPEVDHPDEEQEMVKLKNHAAYNIVIGAYTVGKAQRINKLINKHLPGHTVMVHPETARYHHVYEKAGMTPGDWQPYNSQHFHRRSGQILLVPPRMLPSYYAMEGVVTTFATGWNRPMFRSNFRFHISDHADWKELTWLIRNSGARQVYTVHGDGNALKNYFNNSELNIQVNSL